MKEIMENLEKIKRVAVCAAQKAGKYILKRSATPKDISFKSNLNNLVTDVDKASEAIIIGEINKHFPDHSILAEESGEKSSSSGVKWVIDPIDGTTNYAHNFPFYCVSIGIMAGGTVKIGVVYDPTRQELFTAEASKGAYLNGKKISVSQRKTVQESLFATGFSYTFDERMANVERFKTMLANAQALRRAGSAALDLCYVACGRFDGYWERGLSPWDSAAGQLIVKEAGGFVTKFHGEDYDIFSREILAANPYVHAEMMRLLK